MKLALVLAAAAVAAALFLTFAGHPPFEEAAGQTQAGTLAADSAAAGPRTPVLVELFTSEGCSSCPPADALLMHLEQVQPVAGAQLIVLSWHVDYWNYIGWRDPFSSADYSARQSAYAASFGLNGVYTPQMIVDGGSEFVGSSEGRARSAIARSVGAAKPAIELGLAQTGSADKLSVRIPALPNATAGDAPEVFLVVTESGLRSSVTRGENRGRQLVHTGVVRDFLLLGEANPAASPALATQTALRLDPAWSRAHLRAVVFVQERNSRRVLAAAQIPVPAR